MTEKFNARSAGELLRAAREKQGLHIAALAASIKVAPRKLDALEHDRWDELPDATFTRALAQTVCRQLKIDPAPVMELLPRAGAPTLQTDAGGLNTPFRERPGRDDPGLSFGAVRPMVLAAALLMLAAVAVYFVPEKFWAGKTLLPATAASLGASAPQATPAAASSPAVVAVGPEPATLQPAVPDAAVPDAASASPASPGPASASATSSGATAPSAVPLPAPTAVLPARAALSESPAALPAAAAAPATGGSVQLRVKSSSWIEARDAAGKLLFSRVLIAGERVGLDGALPIRMTIGNAAATELDFRGQAFDLNAIAVNNVARVELK